MKAKSTLLLFVVFIQSILSGVLSPVQAQCSGAPSLSFRNPVLIGGTAAKVGAIYKFANAAPGLDVHAEILILKNTTLFNPDVPGSVQGYHDAWQPYVTAGPRDTSYLEWKFSFKKAGTLIDTILPCLAVTALDIDGDNGQLKEFVEAGTPGSYSVAPTSNLEVSFNGVKSKAIGKVTTIPNIDSSRREAMFQMNFMNVSSIIYRNGAISKKAVPDTRHTSIYFKPFFNTYIVLPVRWLDFTGRRSGSEVTLQWSVAHEEGATDYHVQRSTDQFNWTTIKTIKSNGVSAPEKKYTVADPHADKQKVFYRIRQISYNQQEAYSKTIRLDGLNSQGISVQKFVQSGNRLQLFINTDQSQNLQARIYNMNGQQVTARNFHVVTGRNTCQLQTSQRQTGVLMVVLSNEQGRAVYTDKFMVQ
ncbi:T9SS type A sorting domain-containing protein [Flavihumibacter stibioxidans]|uniref:Uncharacterized protein n=1 Tax=Flavihumibacter stibioxidans TaxID=1834163 RepID=A0ABR7M398_9BACT|nr:T9SS type A sorting domain-containing protein [Flavihumibacter stibioxidans]MBC6489485.1 hypothetical protein [Flavihumibacter stibioxidans]